ncbi:MAG: peptidylprolyl isomerase [Salinibacter sp.]
MSRSLRRLFCVTVVASAVLLSGCGGSGSSGAGVPYQVGEPLSDSTLALVVSSEYGTDTLSASQYRRQTKMRLQRLSPDQRSPDTIQAIHRDLVRRFAEGHVMRGRARAEDLPVDSAQVNRRLKQIRSKYQSKAQLQKQLAQNNMTMDSLRTLIAERLQTQQLQQQMADNAEAPSDVEVQKYSKQNRRIRAQHILLRAGQNAPQSKVDSARQAAAALIDSAKAGADFAALARRHSEGPSASQGGDLGFFTRDQMVDPFAEAAFALSDSGDIAPEPVRTRFGFHVIRLTNAGEPMDTSKARKQMMQERRKQAFEDQLAKLVQGATVRTNPDVVDAGLNEG